MLRFIIKRLWYGLLVLFGVVTVVFFLFNILPGDPARMMLGQRADIASVEAINKDLGRDKPLHIQYFNFLNDISPVSVHNTKNEGSYWYFDDKKYTGVELIPLGGTGIFLKKPYLRRSYQSQRKVSEILSEAFPKTMLLAGVSILFALIFGVGIGVLLAVKKNVILDRVALVFSVLGMSIPSFFAAILNAWIFAFVLVIRLMITGVGSTST